jgi:hypothetical protein
LGRFWTTHWRFRNWPQDYDGKPLRRTAGDSFGKRDISIGDTVYIISLNDGQLYLGGRLVVKQIISRQKAIKLYDDKLLYPAKEWVVALEHSGTPFDPHRRLSPKLTKQLRFVTKSDRSKELFFISGTTRLYNQATRGVRELTGHSAALLDRIIDATDRLPRTGKLLTVTERMLDDAKNTASKRERLQANIPPKAADLQPPPPGRVETTTNRIIRDTDLARRVKGRFRNQMRQLARRN